MIFLPNLTIKKKVFWKLKIPHSIPKINKRKCEKCKNKLQVKKEKFNVLDLTG